MTSTSIQQFKFLRAQKKHLDETDAVFQYYKSKDHVGLMVDVGVHTGSASLPFIDFGWKVIGFEPNHLNSKHFFNKLSSRSYTKQSNTDIREIALSDKKSAPLKFYFSDISSGISGLSSFHDSHKALKEVEVATLKDQLKENDKKIDFLKIDTEGFDLFVLQGFEWGSDRPAIIECEYEDAKTLDLGYSWKQLADYLVDKGYFLLVSEWHPIIQYGVQHDWCCLKRYPCDLESKDSWGNILAFESDELRDEFEAFFVQRYLASNNYQPVNPFPVYQKTNLHKCVKKVDLIRAESKDAHIRYIYQGHFIPGSQLYANIDLEIKTETSLKILLIRHGSTIGEKSEIIVKLKAGMNNVSLKHECQNYHSHFGVQFDGFHEIIVHNVNFSMFTPKGFNSSLFSQPSDNSYSIESLPSDNSKLNRASKVFARDEIYYQLENLLLERDSINTFEALLPLISAVTSHNPEISAIEKYNILNLLAESQLKSEHNLSRLQINLSIDKFIDNDKSEGIKSLPLTEESNRFDFTQNQFYLAVGIFTIEIEAEINLASLVFEIISEHDEAVVYSYTLNPSSDTTNRLHRFSFHCSKVVVSPCFIRIRLVKYIPNQSCILYGIALKQVHAIDQPLKSCVDESLFKDYQKQNIPIFIKNTSESVDSEDINKLYTLHDKFRGERIFIMGNGPSLNDTPLEMLKDEYVFGLNRCSLLFDRISWRPTFYTAFDVRVVPDNADEFSNIDVEYKFFSARYKRLLGLKKNHYWHHVKAYYDGFDQAFTDHAPYLGFGGGGTIGVMAIELAFFMGFDPIYLIGTDVSYSVKNTVNQSGDSVHGDGIKLKLESTDDDDDNHFDPRYFGKGKKWHNPNPKDMMIGFGRAHEYIKARERTLLNATVGGKLNTVPRIDFRSLF